MNRYDLEKKIITKALKDPSFKKKLLSSPKEAVKEALKGDKNVNLKVLDNIHLHIHQEKESEITLVLPYVKETNKALSDKEIENLFAACGGGSWNTMEGC